MILYDTLRTGQYFCEELSSRIHVIYMDDLFSVRYKKMLDVIKAQSLDGINAMGNFGENIPRSLLAIYEKSPMLQKLLLQIEKKLISISENEAPAKFDRALLVSSVEQDILASRTNAENIFSIPPRLDGHSVGSRKWSGAPDFIFLGSLNLAHNAHAIESFIANHMARLTHLIPNVHISIIGGGAAPNLKSMVARNSKHVSLRGFVDDLDALLLGACAMISPLMFGSGIKLKVIDSLRCGVPLVTTQHGIEGIEVDDGAGILLRDSLEDFPAAMQCLLDPAVNSRTSAANARLYRRYYSPTAVDNVYEHILLSRKASPPKVSGTKELTVSL
jgi:Glycosyl transferases group 1